MRTSPLTYQDYLNGTPGDPLPLVTKIGEGGKLYAACPCRPALMQRAILLVDCRHIARAIVEQSWACPECWSSWIRASGAAANLYEIVKTGQGSGALRGEVARASRHGDHPDRRAVRRQLVAAKEDGALHMPAPTKHCFTRTLWMEMHGVENADRYRGTKFDFIP